MLKKLLGLAVVVCLTAALAACGHSQAAANPGEDGPEETAMTTTSTTASGTKKKPTATTTKKSTTTTAEEETVVATTEGTTKKPVTTATTVPTPEPTTTATAGKSVTMTKKVITTTTAMVTTTTAYVPSYQWETIIDKFGDERRIYTGLTTEISFTDDCVLVVIKKRFSDVERSFYPSDFPEIECMEVKSLSTFAHSDPYFFQYILQLDLKYPDKQSVLDAIDVLINNELIYCAQPNFIHTNINIGGNQE